MTLVMAQQLNDMFQAEAQAPVVCIVTEPNRATGAAAEVRRHGTQVDRPGGRVEVPVALVTAEATLEAKDHREDLQARLGDPTDHRMVGPGGLRMEAPAATDQLGGPARCVVCIIEYGARSVSDSPTVAVEGRHPVDQVDLVGPAVVIPAEGTVGVRSTTPIGYKAWALIRT